MVYQGVTCLDADTHELQVSAEASDLNVVLFTSAIEPGDVWVALELAEAGNRSGLTITRESAQRLARSLGSLLGSVTSRSTE